METAQPGLAAENVALDDAASAFKAFTNPEPAQPRNDRGQFAPVQQEAVEDEDLPPAQDAEDGADLDAADDEQEVAEAADEAQQDAVDMPSSWSKDDAELWQALPADAQAKIAEREAQREAGLNAKLMEAANARKAIEAQAAEANANRDAYAQAIDAVIGLVATPEPDPARFGLGTDNFDRDSYDIAVYNWKQTQAQVQGLLQQRQAITAQQEQEAQQARQLAVQEIEQVAWPKFVETVPELADPTKGRQVIADIVQYAVAEGLPQEVFQNGAVNSHEMRLLWKAKEYDRIKSAETRVKAGNPPPKPATPPVRPGGITPRATVQANRLGKAQSRLAKEGSIEAGAAVFKHFL